MKRTARSNAFSMLGAVLVMGLVAGCGDDADPEPTESAGAAPSGEIAGCWTEDQRVESEAQAIQFSAPPAMAIDPSRSYTALLDTNKGPITIELLPEAAPMTVNNFVCLARAGYYTDVPFHRVVEGFVIQGGDPTGTGSGGPGYRFPDEPVQGEYTPGAVAMANAGPDTNGSQFFIITADLTQRLPKQYNLFGRVVGGQEAIDAIAAVPREVNPNSGEESVPTEPITLNSVTITEE